MGHLVTVEYDAAWQAIVLKQLKEAGVDNVDLRFVALEHPTSEPTRPSYDPMPKYVSLVEAFPDEYFDFIEVDGHYRQACVAAGVPKLRRGGFLLVDDTNWLPMEQWGVPGEWLLVHQSVKINTTTSIWKRP